MQIAFFDFDGTITTKDTFLEFIKFTHGKLRFYIGFLWVSPYLLLYKLKVIPNWKAKEKVISYFYKGYYYSDLQQLGRQFCLQKVPQLIKPAALERIRWHQAEGHKIVIISASVDVWLKTWCDSMNIELIATHLEVVGGKVTGKLGCMNCYGVEKVNRIKKLSLYRIMNSFMPMEIAGEIKKCLNYPISSITNISNFFD